MISKFFIALLLGAGLIACSDVYEITVQSQQLEINESAGTNAGLDSLIAPYRSEMNAEMNEVIAYASHDFVKGRPHGALNNWAADAIFLQQTTLEERTPAFCLLNVGGLRNPLSQGAVTVGDIYKLMPFDNEVVWVEMPIESLSDIITYLKATGGEPIAGASLQGDTFTFDAPLENATTFWVITSDYLMNGGDKMTFFEKKIRTEYAGVLMRDAMLQQAKEQDTLIFDNQPRMQF